MILDKKKVLFIHHGSIAGGAPLSMLYTMQGMREAGYEPMAALVKPSVALHELYNTNGFETVETPWIPIFITWSGSEGKRWNPFMWKGVFNAWNKWKTAQAKLEDLLHELSIDIVHLNSVALSNPADLLMRTKFPFIWHVREHGPKHKGVRYRFLQEKLLAAKQVIFLSKAEQISWVGDSTHGTVVNNFINVRQFDSSISGEALRNEYGIDSGTQIILYVGGKKKHKGIFELLNSLILLKKEYKGSFVCLMPDSKLPDTDKQSYVDKRIAKIIQMEGLSDHCILLPFKPNIVEMFAACDLLVFPATKPHFARPIIEASAMGKPVVASDLPAIDELVIEGETGFLVEAGNASEIAKKIKQILGNQDLAKNMGQRGKQFALKEFEYENQMGKIISVYHNLK